MEKQMIPSKIVGIQFSLFSPEEIEKYSVVEVTNKETYVGIRPKVGGLFDPRMGVLEPGLICPTDGMNYIDCPGYFGHIRLAKPVFYIHYIDTIIEVLKCVCIKCSKWSYSHHCSLTYNTSSILISVKTAIVYIPILISYRSTIALTDSISQSTCWE